MNAGYKKAWGINRFLPGRAIGKFKIYANRPVDVRVEPSSIGRALENVPVSAGFSDGDFWACDGRLEPVKIDRSAFSQSERLPNAERSEVFK